MANPPIKYVRIKNLDINEPDADFVVEPGARVSSVLAALGRPTGCFLVDPKNPDQEFDLSHDLFDLIGHGQDLVLAPLLVAANGQASATKHISIKDIARNNPATTLGIEPGTRVSDVLKSIGHPTGFYLVDINNPDKEYRSTDDLYAAVDDGQVLALTAEVDAGTVEVAA